MDKNRKRDAFLTAHIGMGDMIHMNGAVRYLTTLYDTVTIVSLRSYSQNTVDMYKDDSSIKILITEDASDIIPGYGASLESFRHLTADYDLFVCGKHKNPEFIGDIPHKNSDVPPDPTNTDLALPDLFYRHLGINLEVAFSHFKVPVSDKALQLLDIARSCSSSIIFTHTKASSSRIADSVFERIRKEYPDALIINPDKNPYPPNHAFHDISNEFLNFRIMDYILLMENASALYLIDSVFFALAHYIQKPAGQRVYCIHRPYFDPFYRNSGLRIPNLVFVETKQDMQAALNEFLAGLGISEPEMKQRIADGLSVELVREHFQVFLANYTITLHPRFSV